MVGPQSTICPDCRGTWDAPLKGWHVCPVCQTARAERRFERICPHEYAITDESRLPQEQWEAVKIWKPSNRGLLLRGATRAGKTRCAWMLIKRLAKAGVRTLAFSPLGFHNELVRKQLDGEGKDFIDKCGRADLVFLDDIGKGKMTENVEAFLFELIEVRTSSGLPTIATTNDSGDSLQSRMSSPRALPFLARIREFFEIITFPEPIENG